MRPDAFAGFSDPISSWSHLLAAITAAIGSVLLLRRGKGNPARLIALGVFSFSLVFLFSMSGVYHLLDRDGLARPVLQRLDIAAIWTLIAGTFTPIHVILFRGLWRWGMLFVIWTLAIMGLVLHVVFFSSFPTELAIALFVGLGWMGAFSMYHFRKRFFDDPSIRLVFLGGLSYTIGAVLEGFNTPVIWTGVLGPHEIFHFFVILGAAFHWTFVYRWAAHPVQDVMDIEVRNYPGDHFVAIARKESIRIGASSLEDLKANIQRAVSERYHSRLEPKIHLHYFQNEFLDRDGDSGRAP